MQNQLEMVLRKGDIPAAGISFFLFTSTRGSSWSSEVVTAVTAMTASLPPSPVEGNILSDSTGMAADWWSVARSNISIKIPNSAWKSANPMKEIDRKEGR